MFHQHRGDGNRHTVNLFPGPSSLRSRRPVILYTSPLLTQTQRWTLMSSPLMEYSHPCHPGGKGRKGRGHQEGGGLRFQHEQWTRGQREPCVSPPNSMFCQWHEEFKAWVRKAFKKGATFFTIPQKGNKHVCLYACMCVDLYSDA